MGISYDPPSKKWNVEYERTDYREDYPIDNSPAPTQEQFGIASTKWEQMKDKQNGEKFTALVAAYKTWENQQALNAQYTQLKNINTTLNQQNKYKNQAYDSTVATASSTQGGDYVTQRNIIRKIEGLDDRTKKTLEDYYKAFYLKEKIEPDRWYLAPEDQKKEENKTPYGTFDYSYYKTQSPAAAEQWASAVANDDIDITERYGGEVGYYQHHYITVGKRLNLRGNKAEDTKAANEFIQKKLTDKDIADARDKYLGLELGKDTQTKRLLEIPAIAAEWKKAKNGDPYWKEQAKEKFLDVKEEDEFVALFRLSNRPEDQIVRLNNGVNRDYGITELEDAIGEAVGGKATVDVKRFGALTQDVLKQTIAEMKKAKAREQNMSMFKGFGAFSEITNINKELSNSILGDSGVGGILSFAGGNKTQESLEKSLTGITGVNTNNTVYNWQKWFDETLKTKYDENLDLGYTTDEAKGQVKIDAGFAKEFIDKYLTPRFNQSKSMDEFVEYLDVRQAEKNPFQTQDILDAVKLTANTHADKYLDDIKQADRNNSTFNSDFYFNPIGNKGREEAYADQAATVAADWEAAKNGDAYWKTQAYRFGVDINDKEQFAKMHFEVKGQHKDYDPAEDILNAGKVSDYITTQILPALKESALRSGSVFGQFITPDELADSMLKGLDPNDKKTWDEVLKLYGISDFTGTIEKLKEHVKETLRTGSAQEIRENIKYLNEKRQKPTQEKLGVTYIERSEDYKDEKIKGETQLYKTFQSAGFQGTEDEFYNDFFPDMDRGEQVLLTKSGKNEALKTTGLDFKDPFASLGTIEGFFDADEPKTTTEKPEPKTNSYFRIAMGEDEGEEEPLTKSKSGASILGEFTSMFKGL